MELFLTIVSLLILAETSVLLLIKLINARSRKAKQAGQNKVFIDSSTLMDGRILAVAETGFLSGLEILVPRSVVREMQLLADGSDNEKRARARAGLDVVAKLEASDQASVRVFHDDDGRVKVDERLLELAHREGGMIMTNDYNLIKVAATEEIKALNINVLAQSLRSEFLPGDKLDVKVVGPGSNAKQGVAYLPDGTMVVIDEAEPFIGKKTSLRVEFVRYLQTAAGKMMFAKIVSPGKKAQNANKNTQNTGKKTPRNKYGHKA